MKADDWTSPSGIDIRALVWGLLTVARAFTLSNLDEDGAVQMLIIDGEKFFEATESED